MAHPGHLLKILGLAFGLAAVVGNMVGQGILRSPGVVATGISEPAFILLAWLAGGVIATTAGLVYVELGTSIPRAGGQYDFVARAFGPTAGTVAGWVLVVDTCLSLALLATVVGEFVSRLLPDLFASPVPPSVAALAGLWLLAWTGTELSSKAQIAFSAAKGIFLIGLVLVLFLIVTPATASRTAAPMGNAPVGLLAVVMAMRAVTTTYNGWQHLTYYSEEMTDPGRNLPRAMFGGVAAVTIVYVLFNAAILNVLTPAEIASSKLPAGDAAGRVLGAQADLILTVFSILSVSAILGIRMMSASRLGFSLARGGGLPIYFAQVSESGTPRQALTAMVLLSAALVASGSYEPLLASVAANSSAMVIACVAAAIRLRIREPELARPSRMPLYPLPAILALVFYGGLLAVFVYDDPMNSLRGLGLVALIAVLALITRVVRGRRAATA